MNDDIDTTHKIIRDYKYDCGWVQVNPHITESNPFSPMQLKVAIRNIGATTEDDPPNYQYVIWYECSGKEKIISRYPVRIRKVPIFPTEDSCKQAAKEALLLMLRHTIAAIEGELCRCNHILAQHDCTSLCNECTCSEFVQSGSGL